MLAVQIRNPMRRAVLALAALALVASAAGAAERERIRVPVGRGEVITSTDDVRTVAIAEPKIADAAVGSAKTVVVNAKAPGITTLVVYNEGARFKVYDIEVYIPSGEKLVSLKVNVSELSDGAQRELGFDYNFDVTSTVPWLDGSLSGGLFVENTGIGTRDGVLQYVRTSGDLALSTQWKALEETGDIRTLANPTLIARSGSKATFLSGGQFPVPIASGGGATISGVATQTITIEWKEFGVRLNFTPTILEDGSVLLEVAPEVSALDFSTPLKVSGFEVPVIRTNRASTVVSLKPGEHLVLGGLKYQTTVKSERRVPILGQIPLIGFFFRAMSSTVADKNLLITVSPDLIVAAATAPELPTDGSIPGTFDPKRK